MPNPQTPQGDPIANYYGQLGVVDKATIPADVFATTMAAKEKALSVTARTAKRRAAAAASAKMFGKANAVMVAPQMALEAYTNTRDGWGNAIEAQDARTKLEGDPVGAAVIRGLDGVGSPLTTLANAGSRVGSGVGSAFDAFATNQQTQMIVEGRKRRDFAKLRSPLDLSQPAPAPTRPIPAAPAPIPAAPAPARPTLQGIPGIDDTTEITPAPQFRAATR